MITNRLVDFETAAFEKKDLQNADKNQKRVLILNDENSKTDIENKKKNIKTSENE